MLRNPSRDFGSHQDTQRKQSFKLGAPTKFPLQIPIPDSQSRFPIQIPFPGALLALGWSLECLGYPGGHGQTPDIGEVPPRGFQEIPVGGKNAPRGLGFFGRPMPGGHGAVPIGISRQGIERCPRCVAKGRKRAPGMSPVGATAPGEGQPGSAGTGICRKQGPGKKKSRAPAPAPEDLMQSALKCK